MSSMVCFKPEDIIFLLNKWDVLLEDDDKENYFKNTKETLLAKWNEIDDGNILIISAGRVRIINGNGETCIFLFTKGYNPVIMCNTYH